MGDLVSVQAGWAIWSKHPGAHADYAVLDSSTGPLSTAEFSSVLAHFAPGNPPAERDTPASLPWVMLSRVGVDEKTYLGVSRQVPTEYVDATGRPISRTCYMCIPYENLTHDPVSYRGLSEALAAVRLPPEGGGLVPLMIPRLDPGELARSVVDFGPNVVATTAALLLSGPVTITGPDFPDTQTRLRFLDAVAALLPYGYRASYTAATWSGTGAGPRFRMVFANRARDEASQVTWGTAARVPAGGPGPTYLAYLRRVAGKQPVDTTELARLIDYLSRETGQRKFEQPEQAVASLGEFFRAAVVAEAIDAGTVQVADIRRLFAHGQYRQLAPAQQRRLLGHIIAAGDVQDWPLISERFAPIADGQPQVLLPAIAKTCHRVLWSEAPKDLVANYLRLMDPYGLADDLLARLMAPPRSTAGLESGLEAAAALLADFVIGDSAGPASYQETRQALAGNAAAGAALLARLCASQHGIASLGIAVEWLEPVLDRVLPKFNAVLGDAVDSGTGVALEPVGAGAVDELSRDGGQLCVRYLLRAASYRGRLHLVLPGLAPWVAWQVIKGAAVDRRYWNDVAMELTPATSGEAAWLDLTLLATHNDPRSLLAGRFASPQFNAGLMAAWQDLTALLQSSDKGQATDELLTSALIDFLGHHPWRADQAQADIVADLAGRLTAAGARPQLTAVVLDPTEALRQLPRQASSAQIAQGCARAYAEGLLPEQAGRALAESQIIASGARAAVVLEQLHRALSADGSEAAHRWQMAFAAMFAEGLFGPQTAADFAAAIVRNSSTEIAYQLRLLYIAARCSIEGAPPVMSEADLEYLDENRGFLQAILRDARKRQGKRLIGLSRPGWKDAKGGEGGAG